ncbi:MAG TPA: Ig-like domain repeat protein [Solirubrobacteraceae bacterium]|nr:Ig-like domain repeat protein [Solirubrobacteraceae bacterium]
MLRGRGFYIVRRSWLLALPVLLAVLAVPSSAAALSDFTWSGATAAPNWSAAGNWGGAAPSGSVGTLTFPALGSCSTCYSSVNDVSGVSANAISIDDSVPYQIAGNGLTLGAGGITAAPSTAASGANITLPLTLGAPQTWSITGGASSQQLGVGTVTGSADALAVSFASSGILALQDLEAGAVTVTGDGVAVIFGSLNGTDGNSVSLSSPARLAAFAPGATSGPLASTGGDIQIGQGQPRDATLAVNGDVTLDSGTTLTTFIDQTGTTPSTDYSQLTAGGAVTLDGSLVVRGRGGGTQCPALHVGDVYTLVRTTGSLSGTFTGLPDGSTLTLLCSTGTAPTLTIHYTANSVTATVASTAPGGTTTGVVASPSTATTNQPVTLTATVGPSSSSPAGTVEFYNDGVPISGCSSQPVTLTGASYTATCQTSFAASPAPSVIATFTPSSSLQGSTSSVAQLTVDRDATTTTLGVSSATPTVGTLVTYTATITPADSGPAQPTGSVQFLDNGTPIPDCAGQEAVIGGQAICALSYPAPGSHSITASYSGDGSFTGSISAAQAVNAEPPVPAYAGTPPSISGSTTQGQTLSETHGSWTNSPTGYNYQWEECDSVGAHCTAIAGATSATYTLTSSDVGHTIRVLEAAFNAGGPSGVAAPSAATGVVSPPSAPPTLPVSSSPPVITGPTTVGRTLSTNNGAWSGTPPSGYAYQWQRCSSTGCANIAGAIASTYDLTTSELGMKVRVVVVAINSVGPGVGVSSKVGPVVGIAQIKASLAKNMTPKGAPAKIGSILKVGGYELSFTALESGRVVIGWYLVPAGVRLAAAKPVLVASGQATFTAAGTKQIKIRLTAAGRKLLVKSKRLKLTSKAVFSTSGQAPIVVRKTFILRR